MIWKSLVFSHTGLRRRVRVEDYDGGSWISDAFCAWIKGRVWFDTNLKTKKTGEWLSRRSHLLVTRFGSELRARIRRTLNGLVQNEIQAFESSEKVGFVIVTQMRHELRCHPAGN
jgi:hypothetical protein